MTMRTIHRAVTGALATAAVTAAVLTVPAAAGTADGTASGRHDRHSATRSAMEAQIRAGIPGVLGQTRDAGGTWQGSAGVADLDTGRPRLPQDRFRIGSVSKVFTSVVLLQLEAEGRLSLDDSVDRWLPGVVRGNGHDGRKITVRQLLNHTSGVYNYTADPEFQKLLGPGFREHRFETHTPAELVKIATSHAPDFRPGEGWNYSNTNYILAGLITEKVTGHAYATEIERRIIRPLGLRGTTLPGTSPKMPDPHGTAYTSALSADPATKPFDATELNPSWGWAAGEIISTTGDLNRFYGALIGGKLLPGAQQRELMTTVSTGGKLPGARYGLGVAEIPLSCGVTVWSHTGGIHGSLTMAASTAGGKHTAAFNLNGDWAGDLTALVEGEYCGKTPSGDSAARTPERAPQKVMTLR
ncbi:serine hydrolase domain-containing protein [Streptomyces sp. VNUA116]|uniref:serine hydrolase domain-containing protein n=1 Tax=Streptomyces sp. VNUA116 TaxID=3062449 RepID=UPI0026753787|nr:serine hydrolase domain-containing protein [Streptomyces sp. VNUA116]WKU43641.1 serine hydrolase domain-containing protein [Streptomyces sp. VNUA116]